MLMIEKGPNIYGVLDNDINRIVQDYRAGRINDAAFKMLITEWKTNWHRRIAEIVPGHTLQVLVNSENGLPVFRLTPNSPEPDGNVLDARTGQPKHLMPGTTPTTEQIDEKTGIAKHLLPQKTKPKWRGPFGRG